MNQNGKRCSACGADMESLASGILLLRQSRWLRADLTARELEVEALRCPHCGQLAFFDADFTSAEPGQKG